MHSYQVQSTLFDVWMTWPRLPVDIVFLAIGSNEAPMREASAKHVDIYTASIWR